MVKYIKFGLIGSLSSILLTGTALAGNLAAPAYTPDLVPANPNSGECYMRVPIEAQYSASTETVLMRDGYRKPGVVQPVLATRQENILVKEASVRYQVRQPTYRTVSEQVMVSPSYDKLSVSDPEFRTVVETVQTSKPRLVWKLGNPAELRAQGYKIRSTADGGRMGRGYSSTAQFGFEGGKNCGASCEIWCLVEEPAKSVSFKRKVLASPGVVRRTPVPARYQNVTKKVVADAGGVTKVPVPAEYRTLNVEDIVRPGRETYADVPPQYGTIPTKDLLSPEGYEWRRVLCAPGTIPREMLSSVSGSASYSTSGHSSSYGSGTMSYGSGTSYNSGYSSGGGTSRAISRTYGGSEGHSTGYYSSGTNSTDTYSSGYQSGQTVSGTGGEYIYSDVNTSYQSETTRKHNGKVHHRSPHRTR